MTTILIARHGNTFDPGDKVVRLGLTDLPLSNSGRLQAEKLGLILKKYKITQGFCSQLKRTYETMTIAANIAGLSFPIQHYAMFNEIDYGPDEGKTDQEIIVRIGEQALRSWDKDAKAPPGWLVDPQQLIKNWFDFAKKIRSDFKGQTVLVVTSNGIARFAPYLTGNFVEFSNNHKIKMATGAISSFSIDDLTTEENWRVDYWNDVV